MTDAEPFLLPAEMADAIVAHARREAPRECCGIIAGAEGVLRELYPLVNLYPGDDFYEVDHAELYRLYLLFEQRGWEIAAIYHSHPVSPAYPSERDVAYAGWPEAVYLICSLEQPEAPTIRGYRIVDGQIREVSIGRRTATAHEQPADSIR